MKIVIKLSNSTLEQYITGLGRTTHIVNTEHDAKLN